MNPPIGVKETEVALLLLRNISSLLGASHLAPDFWGKTFRVGSFLARVPTSPNPSKGFTMKSPRIYTYKVSFEEVPHFYWGVHKERFYRDGYLGSPVTHKWMWEFYTPILQILEVFPNTDEGWNEAIKVEKRLIMPDLHNPLCLNEACGAFYSLGTLRLAASLGGKAAALNRNEDGKSVASVKAALVTHSVKDMDGKSVVAKKGGNRTKELGVGICSPENRSAAGKIGGKVTSSQVWESTIDGYRGSAGSIALRHKARGWDTNARIRIS